ncbi:hypothetical protein HDU91_002439, partial [Kappamyces sp. JEL0680]
ALRGGRISEKLQNALCAHACFISTHPTLFGGNPKPTFQQRVQAASRFKVSFDQEAFTGGEVLDNQALCDEIRAMLIHSLTMYSIGNPLEAFTIYCTPRRLTVGAGIVKAKFHHFFNAVTFFNPSSFVVTPDTLMSYLPSADNPTKHLSVYERHDRIGIMLFCVCTDTFSSISQGTDFMIDETQIPELVLPFPDRWAPEFAFVSRHKQPSFAKDSIWHATSLASMFDDILENQVALEQFKDFAAWRTFGMLQFFKIFRSVIRFARLSKSDWTQEQIDVGILELHTKLLCYMENLPPSFLPISDLKAFAPASAAPVPLPSSFARCSYEFSSFYMVFLTNLTYLHLPNAQAQSQTRFSIAYLDTIDTFTSKEIMYIVARAVEYICECAYTPIREGESMFGPFMYSSANVVHGLDPDVPSPILFEAPYAMLLYLIGSSCILASRASPSDPSQVQEVDRIVSATILPCIDRIACLWPVANMFVQKLNDVLKTGTGASTDSLFGAQESR